MSLCLAAAGIALRLSATTFTLGWTHSVEQTPWEERWRVTGERLVLDEARIKGSGAGMEPPPEAQFVEGWYVWRPAGAARSEIVLRRGVGVGDWRLCTGEDGCRAIGAILGADADPVRLYPCP